MKIINNIYFYGPFLRLKGITFNQINLRHAFMIYFVLVPKSSIRNLEENKIKIPALCEIRDDVEESNNDINMVEYECIGNYTSNENLTDFNLFMIEEGNNENILKKSNLDYLASSINLEQLENKNNSEFTLENLMEIIIFEMNIENKTIKSNNYKFNFIINGSLNKDLGKTFSIKKDFNLSEIETKANCIFTVGENKTGNLNCDLNVENYKNIKTFSFITSQIETTEGDEIYFSKLNDLILINNVEEEEKIKKENKKNKLYIVIIIICCVVFCGIIVGVIIFVKKKCFKSKIVNKENKNNINENEEAEKKEVKENDESKNVILK